MNKLSAIERKLNPFPIYRELRQDDPVYYDDERGSWHVFRYPDVQRVLSDYKTFSSEFARGAGASAEEPFAASMISSDPPRHRQLRTLVSQAFTPRSVDALAPRIQEIVDEYLDKVMADGKMDIMHDLATPLPVIVIAELMGIPAEDRGRFKHWSDWIVSAAAMGTEIDPEMFQSNAVMEMSAYFFDMIEKRKVQPGDDLISGLLQVNIDGQGLELIELLGFCSLLLVAGNETTTNLLGNAMMTFADHPEEWQLLRSNPSLVPQAIEEVLRYRSPVQTMFRVTKQEVEIGGKVIPPNEVVMAWIGSANHDEQQFEDPECFDIQREPNRHLAFGYGIHFCLGAPLARLEGKIALTEMLKRFKTVKKGVTELPERLPSLIVYGIKSFPIEFEAAT